MSIFFRRSLLFLFTMLLFLNCSGPEELTVHQEDQPLEVDGSLTNWDKTATLLKSTSEIDYYATTYGNNLYLFVDVKGLLKHSSITKSGLIIYLSSSEENRKRSGFSYPAGSYNLLRQYPNAFESFTTDIEWSRQPENTEMLTNLGEEIYSSIMVVERPMGMNDAEYGFIDKTQLEVDGFEIAHNEDSRYVSIEMKIPLGETSLFSINQDKFWLGFSIEPPDFNFRDESASTSSGRERYGQRSQRQANINYSISRNLGQDNDWFLIKLQ